jgi:type IV secretion system protein VirB6
MSCPVFDPLGPYIPTVVDFVDCHARALGEDGYRALGFGSPIGLVVSGLVTIYVALIGYRMLLGDLPEIREIVLAAVKIGAVVAIATQWSAYQVLVYDVVVDEPEVLAARILEPGGLGGGGVAGLTARIQGAYDDLDTVIHPEPGHPSANAPAIAFDGNPGTINQPSPSPKQRHNLSAAELESLSGAEKSFLVSTLGGLLSTRIIAAVLLALGPLFIGFFLFDATRGLFVGWLRGLVATIIAGIGVLAVLGIELAILGPQIGTLRQSIDDGFLVPTLTNEVTATCALFALLIATTLVGTSVAAFGLRFPDSVGRHVIKIGERLRSAATANTRGGNGRSIDAPMQNSERSRAQLIADVVNPLGARNEIRSALLGSQRAAFAGNLDSARRSDVPEPFGQNPNRMTKRHSAKARQRDNKS